MLAAWGYDAEGIICEVLEVVKFFVVQFVVQEKMSLQESNHFDNPKAVLLQQSQAVCFEQAQGRIDTATALGHQTSLATATYEPKNPSCPRKTRKDTNKFKNILQLNTPPIW